MSSKITKAAAANHSEATFSPAKPMYAGDHFKNRAGRKMSRVTLCSLIFLLTGIAVYAQDVITLRNGDEIKSKVTEISSSEIRYKRFENLDGPTIVISRADVFFINYENGTREVFGAISETTTAQPVSAAMAPSGKAPATAATTPSGSGASTIIFYRKNKPIPLIIMSMAVNINCKNPDETITSLWNAGYYKYVTDVPGPREFEYGITKTTGSMRMNLEAGKTYFVSCAVQDKVFGYTATMQVVSEQQALRDMGTLSEVIKQ